MKNFKKLLFATFFVTGLLAVTPTFAGKDEHEGNDEHGEHNEGKRLPINNGIVLLTIAGMAVGTIVLYRKNKTAKSISA